MAGLGHRHCEGVLALTGDDQTKFDVTMTTSLLRPGLPVIARTNSREIAERMRAFGDPEVVNPLDRFGDHLRDPVALAVVSYQLMVWLTSAPGTPLPRRHDPLPRGRWVVSGYGRFGRELTADLRAEGLDVTVVRAGGTGDGEGLEEEAFAEADVEHAAAFVAATENDMTNLWLVERARRANPNACVVTLQNRAANTLLFEAVGVDFGMLPAELIAHEVLARLANPVLMRFLPQVPRQGDEWAGQNGRQARGQVRDRHTGPVPDPPGAGGGTCPGRLAGSRPAGLRRSPAQSLGPRASLGGRAARLAARGNDGDLTGRRLPPAPDDQLLVAGRPGARRALDVTLTDEPTAAYVIRGEFAPSSWVWRRLSGKRSTTPKEPV